MIEDKAGDVDGRSLLVSSVIEVIGRVVVGTESSVVDFLSVTVVVAVVEVVCGGFISFDRRIRQILEGVAAVPAASRLTVALLELEETG